MSDRLKQVITSAREFRDEREWSQFHKPKDLATAIAIEAAELQTEFLWKTEEQVSEALQAPEQKEKIADEVADILLFAFYFADSADIDILEAMASKLKKNGRKYPVEKARGKADKYTEL